VIVTSGRLSESNHRVGEWPITAFSTEERSPMATESAGGIGEVMTH
jgi:hypothetical protein